jgi:hypothetical protein
MRDMFQAHVRGQHPTATQGPPISFHSSIFIPLDKRMERLVNRARDFTQKEPLHKDREPTGNKKGPYVAAGCSPLFLEADFHVFVLALYCLVKYCWK